MDMTLISRWNELKDRKDELADELKEVKAQLAGSEEQILSEFVEEGIQNVKVNGKTVYIHRQVWAAKEEDVSPEEIQAAFDAAGLSEFVTGIYHSSQVSSWLRELEQDDGSFDLPEPLVGIITGVPSYSIRRRKSGKS